MTPAQLDAMCEAAMKAVSAHINRGHAQQSRRMRELWKKS